MTVHCNKGCGREWPRHPALEEPCPSCGAAAGVRCKRPSGHQAAEIHGDRYLKAYDAGHFGECPWQCCRPKERPFPWEGDSVDTPQLAMF